MNIVLALCAPPKNLGRVTHRKEERRPPPSSAGAGGTTTGVSVYKIDDLSYCCYNVLHRKGGSKLSGCAVISKGILVVEGETSYIRKCLKLIIGRKEENSESVKLIWQGKVAKPSFGKFSILHCTSEVAICKFFADHGASHYWDLAVKSD